jgi:HEAT repeat protein
MPEEVRDTGLEPVRAVVLAGHTGDAVQARAALDDPAPAVRAAALGALARCNDLSAGDLRRGLADPDPTVRRRAAEEAGRLGDRAVGGHLAAALDDPDTAVVEAAAHAHGELPDADPAWVAKLAALATGHEEVVVRETAVAALGSTGADAARAAVLAATTDVATVRRRAVLALAAFEGEEIEAALLRLAEDRDRQVRQAAEDLLHGWGATEA